MSRKDRHRFRSSATVKLTDGQVEALQRFLPEQCGVEGKLRYLITVMTEIAQPEPRYRVVPWCPVQEGLTKKYSVGLPDELLAFIKAYGAESGLDSTKQATNFACCGLELMEQLSGTESLRKEELKRQFLEILSRRWTVKAGDSESRPAQL